MDWDKEIDWQKCVSEDTGLIIETVGIDTYMKLAHSMEKATYYFARSNIMAMRREFIVKNAGRYKIRELKKILGCSERFISKVLAEGR